jgi:hypothetical protein
MFFDRARTPISYDAELATWIANANKFDRKSRGA